MDLTKCIESNVCEPFEFWKILYGEEEPFLIFFISLCRSYFMFFFFMSKYTQNDGKQKSEEWV
jgi:hypothetical protein